MQLDLFDVPITDRTQVRRKAGRTGTVRVKNFTHAYLDLATAQIAELHPRFQI